MNNAATRRLDVDHATNGAARVQRIPRSKRCFSRENRRHKLREYRRNDMRTHLLVTALATALVCISGQRPAHAEIYTWVDSQGRLNVGNLAPPDGVRVTKMARETPSNPYNDAAREAAQRAEVDALAQRVDQLQSELQFAARQSQQQQQPQVVVVQVPAPAPYVVESPALPVYAQDCVNGWSGCDAWWGPAFAPFATFVYLPPARNTKPTFHGGRNGHGDGFHGGRPMRRPPMKLAAFANP
jgi:Domain of unknown function (DUF4124)